MNFLWLIFGIVGFVLFIVKLTAAGGNFILSTERNNMPECFREKTINSNLVQAVSDIGFSAFGLIVSLFGISGLATTSITLSPFVAIAAIFNIVSCLLNYIFIKKNNLEKEVARIDRQWSEEKRISLFHDHEVNYYRAIKENIKDRDNSMVVAIALMVLFIFL